MLIRVCHSGQKTKMSRRGPRPTSHTGPPTGCQRDDASSHRRVIRRQIPAMRLGASIPTNGSRCGACTIGISRTPRTRRQGRLRNPLRPLSASPVCADPGVSVRGHLLAPPWSDTKTPSPSLCCTQISEPAMGVTFHAEWREIQSLGSAVLGRPRFAIGMSLKSINRPLRLLTHQSAPAP
jgi:hypothetical protein